VRLDVIKARMGARIWAGERKHVPYSDICKKRTEEPGPRWIFSPDRVVMQATYDRT